MGLDFRGLLWGGFDDALKFLGDVLIPVFRVVAGLQPAARHAVADEATGQPADQGQAHQAKNDKRITAKVHSAQTI